jgi:hypothetical protein
MIGRRNSILLLALGLVTWFSGWGGRRSTLVIYSFTDTDEESMSNLEFFISEAVRDDRRASYVISVNGRVDGLPILPRNSRYVLNPMGDVCLSDWAAYGHGLRESKVDRYRSFIFISSSARGPFLPSYAYHSRAHWTDPFLNRLRGDVKLVGPTISCEGSFTDETVGKGRWRGNPYVGGHALATDQEGLKVLLSDGEVFKCHRNKWEASYYGDVGASTAILASGFNLDSFVTKYQGSLEAPMDWRDKSRWECNGRQSIHGEFMLDGVTVDPLEVEFVKFSRNALIKGISSAVKAEKYTRWMKETRDRRRGIKTNISSNEYQDQSHKFKLPKVLEAKARGSACFDFQFYAEHEKNQDLRDADTGKARLSDSELWNHFVHHGQFEARAYRFNCPYDDSRQ